MTQIVDNTSHNFVEIFEKYFQDYNMKDLDMESKIYEVNIFVRYLRSFIEILEYNFGYEYDDLNEQLQNLVDHLNENYGFSLNHVDLWSEEWTTPYIYTYIGLFSIII